MTVSTLTSRVEYTSGSTVFAYPFRVLDEGDLDVTQVSAAGVETLLTITTHYTVDGVDAATGGNVTLVTALPAGESLIIERRMAVTQPVDLRNQGRFLAETHEKAFDRLTMLVQQQATDHQDALRIADGVYDAGGLRISGLAPGTGLTDAVSRTQMDSAIAAAALVLDSATASHAIDISTDAFTGDFGARVAAALLLVPSQGGVIDARGITGAQVLSADLTLNVSNVVILCGPMDLAMGAFSVVKPSGVHQVELRGQGPWGHGGTNSGSTGGTRFVYTGTGDAVQWGDASGDSYKCNITDIGVNISGAGSAARGIVVKRMIVGTLTRPHVGGTQAASTQRCLVLDGTGNYCGHVLIDQPYLQNGNVGLHFTGSGVNGPNACTVVRAVVNGVLTGTGFLDDAGDQNVVEGDFENWGVGWDLRRKGVHGVARFENNTLDLALSAASQFNVIRALVGSGSTPPLYTDAGSLNTILSASWHTFNRDLMQLRNSADAAQYLILQPGITANQIAGLIFRDYLGVNKWRVQKSAAGNFEVYDDVNLMAWISSIIASGNFQINAAGSGTVQVNAVPNHGTGGFAIYDGGAVPAPVHQFKPTTVGLFGATPVAQPATIAAPAGGATVDAEARTAIAAILTGLKALGIIAT